MLEPGSHGSTFGGNPLACAVAREVVDMMASGEPQHLARERRRPARPPPRRAHAGRRRAEPGGRGPHHRASGPGIDLAPGAGTARAASEQLLRHGVLVKDASDTTSAWRLPSTISAADLDLALDRIVETVGPVG